VEKPFLFFQFLEHPAVGDDHPDLFGQRHGKGDFALGEPADILGQQTQQAYDLGFVDDRQGNILENLQVVPFF
jgi:hypothetical protein